MASIHKLSVRGIRAFSPEDEEQVISFCFPLTIIVGANGCGKTTIIEALKYSVTGALPPGNKSGQAFVHDPKSTGSSCVKAGIKLRFTNRAGKSMVVVRSMELTQKKSSMSFKALDGILRTTDERGNRQSLSHKCSELDRQIPQLLGVSKSILEHVVFCHQEDASWPLMEGSVLKKRFDDIFDSTRYVKALEAIKDTRKRYQSRVKDLKADLGELNGHKHAALGFRQDLNQTSEGLSDVYDEISEFKTKIDAERKRGAAAAKIVEEKAEIEEEAENQRILIDREDVRITEQKKSLREDMTKKFDKGQLQDMLHGFDKITEASKRELDRINRNVEEIKKDIARLHQGKVDIMEERGLITGEKKNYDQAMNTRIHLMEEIANKFGLELTFSQTQETEATFMGTQQTGNDVSVSDRTLSTAESTSVHITEEDLQAFSRSVEAKGIELNKQLNDHMKKSQKDEDAIQHELSEISAQRLSIENDLARCQTERTSAMAEISRMSRGNHARVRKSDIDDLRHQAAKHAKRRDDINSNPRLTEIPREIKDKQSQMMRLKISVEEDNVLLRDLRHCAEEQNSIDILEKQIAKDMEDIESMKSADYDLLEKYDVPMEIEDLMGDGGGLDAASEAMVADVEEKLNLQRKDSERSRQELETVASRLSKKSALLNHNQTTLMQRKDQYESLAGEGRGVLRIKNIVRALRSFEQKAFGNSVSVDIEPQQLLEHVTNRIAEVNSGEEKRDAIVWALKKIRKIANQRDENGNPKRTVCPCCDRDLKTDEDIKVFYQALENLKHGDSDLMKGVSQGQGKSGAIRNYESWRVGISQSINDWMDCKRIGNEINGIEETITNEEDDLVIIKAEHIKATKKDNTLKINCSELQQLQNVAKQFRNDATKVSDKRHKISQSQNELSMMAPTANGKDLLTLERDITKKHEEKDSLMNAVTSLNKDLSDINNQISRISNQASKGEKAVRDMEEKYAAEQKTIEKKQELQATILKCKGNEGKLQDQIAPIRSKEKVKETSKNRYRTAAKAEEQKMQTLLHAFNNDSNNVTTISKQIDEFASSNKLQRLQVVDSEVESLSETVKQKESELKNIEPELASLKAKVGDQDSEKQNIQSNIGLLHTMKKLEKLEDELELIDMKKAEIKGVDDAENEYSDSMKKIRSFEHDINRREGSLDTLKVQQRELKRKLKMREYSDIDERHRVKMIENETCILTVSDLDIYSSALDKALLRYHGMKIEEINKIIHELWTLTYKGEDISSIRLTSDQEKGSKATRSYNYRVVMTKGTTELDMRGRCSAGQRVLASIVIRLALAETFCLNCGVMALDEPTTNLDYANKRGLAIALAHIIASRAAQENFQLVIITHDEDFVSMMKNELAAHTGFPMPERYFQVSREEGADGIYYSKIHSIDWDEL